MQEPSAEPAIPPTSSERPAYLPFGAYAPASALVARPTWTRTYELPSARKVVYAGLQLAAGSNIAIRRASIYIGLLSLGAFGPAAILVLIGLARLLGDPVTAPTLTGDNPFLIFSEQPELAGPLALVYVVAIVGIVLIVAISIDAKAIAIAMLGGAAADGPMTLPEAIARARQTFWRLLGSGLLVGIVSGVVSIALAWPFLRPFDSNQGLTFITSMIGTLVVAPFAFASTGIVLGDAGAIETLRRSYRLFRAGPRIALVVTLFTLVSAAIQTFAFSGGADLASRVATFFHVGEGGASLILPGMLVLALIVAFGSLTFTIAAIVAAPQVTAFLGLTFYSAGLDKARLDAARGARRPRWVSIPMSVVMVGLAVVVVAAIPTIASFHVRAASPLLVVLKDEAMAHGLQLTVLGSNAAVEDPPGDVFGGADGPASSDMLLADVGWFPQAPDWLVQRFDCSAPGVTCADSPRSEDTFLGDGVFLYFQRMAGGPEAVTPGRIGEWGPIFAVDGIVGGSNALGDQFPGATDAVITRRAGAVTLLVAVTYAGPAGYAERATSARSLWIGSDLITLIPSDEVPDFTIGWDAYAGERAPGARQGSYDILRPDPADPLLDPEGAPMFLALPSFAP
jgi:hypothetical protein